MHLHEVVLVPALGHGGPGVYDRGNSIGAFTELDVIDEYLAPLVEELDTENVRHRVLETRTHPGIPPAERPYLIEPHSLVVHLRIGWADGKRAATKRNTTTVSYAQPTSLQLADELGEAIGQWGHCYVWGHRTANPRAVDPAANPLLIVPETKAVEIEPFVLNGPDVDTYLRHLQQLGRAIARAIADHLRMRGQAQARGVLACP